MHPMRVELTHLAPEASALSTELRMHLYYFIIDSKNNQVKKTAVQIIVLPFFNYKIEINFIFKLVINIHLFLYQS